MKEKDSALSRPNFQVNRRTLLAGSATGVAGLSVSSFLAACGSSSTTSKSGTEGNFPSHPAWKFTFVNHVTTNSFFVPTRYGMADAAAAFGCASPQWVGSETSLTSDMVDQMNTAIAAKVDGIAVSLIDATAFNDPVKRALAAGIPVVSYNADAPASSNNARLAYIGQDLYDSGVEVGNHLVGLVPSGDIVGFISTPGTLNIQPRIDGVKAAIAASGKPINFVEIATGATEPEELSAVEAYYLGHKSIKGMVAVDGGSTSAVGQIMAKYSLASKGIHGGGYDLEPLTLQAISQGNLDFTIDQQPYLQGFIPVVQLFLYKLSGGLAQPSTTNTGLLFVTKANVNNYIQIKTRFEGSSTVEQVVPAT
jgi:simple sugar transport system substrate-binding protein